MAEINDNDLDEDKKQNSADANDDDDDDDSDAGDAKLTDAGEEHADGSVTVEEHAVSDEALEKRRQERREERRDRKERIKEKDQRLRRELDSERKARLELENRLATIEKRSSGSEIAQLDATIKTTLQAYNYHKAQLQDATTNSNGVLAADATEKMLLAKQRVDQLTSIKTAFTQRQSAPQPLDNRLVSNANSFMKDNSWYKPDGKDMDSRLTREIDNSLAEEGWDPRTLEYWEELKDRIKKHLPHRSGRATVPSTDGNRQVKSVTTGSGRESSASGNTSSGQFKLSADRVSALKDAGIWDDPKKRDEAIKRYRDYDKKERN